MPTNVGANMSTSQAAMIQRMDEEERKKKRAAAQKGAGQGTAGKESPATGIGTGTATGASVGSVAGPIGTVIGGIVGAVAGGVQANQADKAGPDNDPNRPDRRRMTAVLERAKKKKDERHMAMATLAESVFNWAQSPH